MGRKFTDKDIKELRWKMRSFGGKKGGKVKMCDKPIDKQLEEHKRRSESAKKKILPKRDEKGRFVKEILLSINSKTDEVIYGKWKFNKNSSEWYCFWNFYILKKPFETENQKKILDKILSTKKGLNRSQVAKNRERDNRGRFT